MSLDVILLFENTHNNNTCPYAMLADAILSGTIKESIIELHIDFRRKIIESYEKLLACDETQSGMKYFLAEHHSTRQEHKH